MYSRMRSGIWFDQHSPSLDEEGKESQITSALKVSPCKSTYDQDNREDMTSKSVSHKDLGKIIISQS